MTSRDPENSSRAPEIRPALTREWPIAPKRIVARESWPAIGHKSVQPGMNGPLVTFEGHWLYLIPPAFWTTTPREVRRFLTACYKDGMRSVPEVADHGDEALLRIHNVGPRGVRSFREWYRQVLPPKEK